MKREEQKLSESNSTDKEISLQSFIILHNVTVDKIFDYFEEQIEIKDNTIDLLQRLNDTKSETLNKLSRRTKWKKY